MRISVTHSRMARALVTLALAQTALVACRRDDKDIISQRPLAFKVEADWTKSLVSAESGMRGSSIAVLGAHTAGTTFSGTPTIDFDGNTYLSYINSGWTYSSKRYWIPSSTFRFRAYWPYQSGITFSDDFTSTLTIANFASTADPATQPDLMLSDFYQRATGDFSNPDDYASVPLHFQHLLCNVDVKVMLKEPSSTLTFVVTGVSFNNVKPKGTYTLNYTSTAASNEGVTAAAGTWTASGSEIRCSKDVSDGTLTWNPTTATSSEDGSAVPIIIWEAESGLLLIPQDLSTVTLKIDYTIKQTGKKDQERNATFNLPTQAAYAWTPGRKIVYSVTISRDDKITFGMPSVSEWSPPSISGAIMIK